MEHQSDINHNKSPWNNPCKIGKRLGELKIKGRIETVPTSALMSLAKI